ncbi:hypothetical protein E2C01_080651 [Portunus trituberculatus]|uniref:Uncharacterized protein n=1 Tax=Portunus trituberculatus TaxID=210409 RepID=A0A5B7ITZ2_PORTR|nr:hypothetical protein [Portunus trituberculatus]
MRRTSHKSLLMLRVQVAPTKSTFSSWLTP